MKSSEQLNSLIKMLEETIKERSPANETKAIKSQTMDAITQLQDENQSLWAMLDELKKSEIETWSKSNKDTLQSYVDNHIKYLKWQNKFKGEA